MICSCCWCCTGLKCARGLTRLLGAAVRGHGGSPSCCYRCRGSELPLVRAQAWIGAALPRAAGEVGGGSADLLTVGRRRLLGRRLQGRGLTGVWLLRWWACWSSPERRGSAVARAGGGAAKVGSACCSAAAREGGDLLEEEHLYRTKRKGRLLLDRPCLGKMGAARRKPGWCHGARAAVRGGEDWGRLVNIRIRGRFRRG